MVYKHGDLVRWMLPLDNDYSYGYVIEVKRNYATIECTDYYSGLLVSVHLRYIEKCRRGGGIFGGGKGGGNKRSVIKS